MAWKQPIPTNLDDLCDGDLFASTIMLILLSRAANKRTNVYVDNVAITLERGQCICGRFELAKRMGLNKNQSLKIQRILAKLEKSNNLLNKRKGLNCTIITIKNYDELVKMNNQMNKRRTIDEQSMNTNKSVKSDKKENIDLNEITEIVEIDGFKYEPSGRVTFTRKI